MVMTKEIGINFKNNRDKATAEMLWFCLFYNLYCLTRMKVFLNIIIFILSSIQNETKNQVQTRKLLLTARFRNSMLLCYRTAISFLHSLFLSLHKSL